ncbi:MAG: hypothetical protein AABZ02_02220 [Bacteroidota bacterium]
MKSFTPYVRVLVSPLCFLLIPVTGYKKRQSDQPVSPDASLASQSFARMMSGVSSKALPTS